ncbi:MAG: rRNA maturation RNase YbeY [Bacteroidia bacterium]
MKSVNSKISFYSEETDFEYLHGKVAGIWLESIARDHQFAIGEINYIFCSDDYLLALNRTHLDHDYYTDILTFPYQQKPIISDIYISVDRVKENAETHDTDFEKELHRVMVHGLLHLLGYDDHSEEDVLEMRKAEDLAIQQLNH